MANHFSAIGFHIETPDDFAALAGRVVADSRVLSVPGGRYMKWAGPNGEELWLQTSARGDLMGMNPHFAGKASMRVGLTARIARPRSTALDGAFQGWANPPEAEPTQGHYPFVFDVPDAATHMNLALPCVATVQVAAFAHEIERHASPEAHHAGQGDPGAGMASQSFIPSGLLAHEGESAVPPQAHAVLAGHVLETEELTNPLGGRRYYWALVDSYGGQYDVVADHEQLAGRPERGNVLAGSFWLSGRLLSYPKVERKASWLRRVLGGGR